MRQSIEKQQETMGGQKFVTVMFNDRTSILANIESFRARKGGAPSLSAPLAVGSIVQPASTLSLPLNASGLAEFALHRTRGRTSPSIIKLSAEGLMARSALAVLAANPNKRGLTALVNATTKLTEQRRCAAA